MKLDATAFAMANGAAVGILWIFCSLFVYLVPGPMMTMSGHMVHGDWGMMNWSLSLLGVVLGLVGWVLVAALMGWLVATIYNSVATRRSGRQTA